MMKRMELYSKDALPPERARKKRAMIAMLIIAGIGLAACITLCALVTRRNIQLFLPLTIGISTVMGWIAITILHGSFGNAAAQVKHIDLMLNEQRKTVTGSFEKTGVVRRVKNGMNVRKVRCVENGFERVLSLNEQKASMLPDAFTGTVQTVYDYIVAYEVEEDD